MNAFPLTDKGLIISLGSSAGHPSAPLGEMRRYIVRRALTSPRTSVKVASLTETLPEGRRHGLPDPSSLSTSDCEQSTMAQSGPEKTYKEKLATGSFELQQCTGCKKHVFYPRVVCPHCGCDQLDWVKAKGVGTVYSTTIVRRKPDAGGDYNVALIDLAEGPRMMSRVVDLSPDDVKIGMAVKSRIAGSGEESLIEFIPA